MSHPWHDVHIGPQAPDEAKKAVTHAMALYEKLFSSMHRQKSRA